MSTTLTDIESHLARLRRNLALSRTKTDKKAEAHKLLLRRINDFKRELHHHHNRRLVVELDKKLATGLEQARKGLRDLQDFIHHVDELRLRLETAFNNALDRALPPLNNLLSTVFQRLTHQRSFELVRVYRHPEKIGHLELRVASRRRPDKNYPVNVLNGQASKALHLVPYFVFSRFQPELLELDLLLIDDPSESFDTSHVSYLIEELRIASEHAQLIVASHEQDKFASDVAHHFDEDNCTMMVVSDFDPVSGPSIDRHQLPN